MRLLVVEDAPDIATLLLLAFHIDGYAVDTAASGEQALELAAVNEYDVTILDLGLPDIDGLEVCRQIRQESAVPILILTKRGELDDRVKGYAAGADAYLVKPFLVEEVQAVVQALLRRNGGAPKMEGA